MSDGEGLAGVSLINGMCSFPVLFGAHQKAIPEMSMAVCIVWGGVQGCSCCRAKLESLEYASFWRKRDTPFPF